jgi:gliding motility-associated-like protein
MIISFINYMKNLTPSIKEAVLFCFLSCFSFGIFSQGSGNTLTFNGTSQYVDIGDQVANGCRTIELWFKPNVNITSSITSPRSLVIRDFNNASGQNTDEFGLFFSPNTWGGGINGGKVVFLRRIGTSLIEITSDNNFWEAGHWYHVCGTIDPVNGMRLYINGILQQTTHASTSPIGTQTGSVWDKISIGRWGNINTRHFNGEIDEVRFWEDERTEQEVRDKMCSSLVGNEPGLRAYWNFDSGTGTTLIDNSTNNYDGATQGMTNTSWIYSGAPIGDNSAYLYTGNLAGTSTSLTSGPGDILTVDNINSTAGGVQIYKVNALPNVTTNLSSLNTGNYYGVFLTSTNGTYDLSYDYNAYSCSSCDEIFTRNDNADINWSQITSSPQSCEFNLINESSVGYDYRAEYIISTGAFLNSPDVLGNDTTICAGNSLLLSPQISNSTFLWQDNSTNTTFTVTQPGLYTVEVQNSCGSFTDSIYVTYLSPPSVDLGSDSLICQNIPLVLDPGLNNVNFEWQDNSSNSTFTVTQTGTYFLEVSNVCGVDSDTVEITFETIPNIDLGNDTTICAGNSLLLSPQISNSTFLWQDNSTNPTFTVTQPGLYTVEVQNSCGSSTDSIYVTYLSPPSVDLGSDSVICQNVPLVLDPGLNNVDFQWQDNSTNPTYTVTQTGTYFLEVSNVCGVDTDTVEITFESVPIIDLGNDTTLCDGEQLNLSVTGFSSYLWQDGSSDQSLTITQTGLYWVEVSNSCGIDQDSLNVSFNPTPYFNLGNDTILCEGKILMLEVNVPNTDIVWQDGSNSSVFTIEEPGTYFSTATLDNCSASDTIVVNFSDIPSIELGNDTLICENSNYLLSVNSEDSFIWSNGSTEPSIVINSFGDYFVTVTNQCGQTSDTISIGDLDCSCTYYVPNSFTPDGRKFNEEFGIVYDCKLTDFEFLIFNRWGEIIFESYNPKQLWDGTYKGKLVQNGTYVYRIEFKTEKGIDRLLIGHVTLLN